MGDSSSIFNDTEKVNTTQQEITVEHQSMNIFNFVSSSIILANLSSTTAINEMDYHKENRSSSEAETTDLDPSALHKSGQHQVKTQENVFKTLANRSNNYYIGSLTV